jgi:hypothetical protein
VSAFARDAREWKPPACRGALQADDQASKVVADGLVGDIALGHQVRERRVAGGEAGLVAEPLVDLERLV